MIDNLSAFLIIDTELGSQWSFECMFFRRSSLFQEANFWLLMRAFFSKFVCDSVNSTPSASKS